MIPEKSDTIAARARRGSRGGRPPGLDVSAYRGRNVVERHFALTKQWRGLATRYDKLAITYRAAVVLAACITWSRIYETRPRTLQSPRPCPGRGGAVLRALRARATSQPMGPGQAGIRAYAEGGTVIFL